MSKLITSLVIALVYFLIEVVYLYNNNIDVFFYGLSSLVIISLCIGCCLYYRDFSFTFIFISLTVLFIYSKFIAFLISGDQYYYSVTNLFDSIEIDDNVTVDIFRTYTIIIICLYFLSSIFYSKIDIVLRKNDRFLVATLIANSCVVSILFIPYIYLQINYIQGIWNSSYLAIYTESKVAILNMMSRILYVALPLNFILGLLLSRKSFVFLLVFVVFLVLEILPGQRGHVVLLVLSLISWIYLSKNKQINLKKMFVISLICVFLFAAMDVLRGAKYYDVGAIAHMFDGYGMPLNVHQYVYYYQEELRTDGSYSLFGVIEYFNRLLKINNLNIDYGLRSEELYDVTTYLGHKLTGIVNKKAWLAGYGTGSPFVMELMLDTGYVPAIFLVLVLFSLYLKFSSSSFLMSNPYFGLMYVTIFPYMIYLSRSTLSTMFPKLIFVSIYYFVLIILAHLIYKFVKK